MKAIRPPANLQRQSKFWGAIAFVAAVFLVGYYLKILNLKVDLPLVLPFFGSLATVIPGLWSLYQYFESRLEATEKNCERSHLDFDGRLARIDARLQLLFDEDRIAADIARKILEEMEQADVRR